MRRLRSIAILLLAGGCSTSGNISGQAGSGGGGAAGSSSTGGAGSGAAGATGGAGSGAAGATATGGAGGTTAGPAGATGSGGQPDAGQPGNDGPVAVVGTCSPPDDPYSPIQSLSLTGCVDPSDPTKPTSRAVSYEVNSALWSDGADKTRAFVLPAGQKIHVDATTGKWVFPVGSVLIKSFLFDGKLVETRLFMHIDSATWMGYAYKWNGQGAAKQTEATVVGIDRADVVFDTGKRTVHWYFPSRQDCMSCHNDVAGNTLGPETAQMYRTVAGHTKNQLDELKDLGVFDTAPVPPTASQVLVTPYTSQLGSPPAGATLEQKARSYLQANCAHCHRPNDGFVMSPFPNFDLRYGTAFKDMKICNAPVAKGKILGSDSTTILVPGKPMDSVLWLRMNAAYADTGTNPRMPQIASHVVDAAGVQLIGDWITAQTTCP